MRQSYGIGVDGAAILLTAAGDNPERMRSEASFAALCGASPLPAGSGIRVAIGSAVEATAKPMRPCTVLLSLGCNHQVKVTRSDAERRRVRGSARNPPLLETVHRAGGVPSAHGQNNTADCNHKLIYWTGGVDDL